MNPTLHEILLILFEGKEEKQTHVNGHPLIESSICINFKAIKEIQDYKLKFGNPY